MAAAHWRHGVEVRVGCEVRTEPAREPSLVVSSFWSLVSWLFRAAKSNAVGGGADTVAAAATGEGFGKTGGKRDERGKSVIERSNVLTGGGISLPWHRTG